MARSRPGQTQAGQNNHQQHDCPAIRNSRNALTIHEIVPVTIRRTPASHAPSCGPAARPTCRRDARRRRASPASAAHRSTSSPSRFIISIRPRRIGLPSGQPATARMCCSNCDTEAPSMVQWPELCTRGAISLTSTACPVPSAHDEHLDRRARRHSRAPRAMRRGDARAPAAATAGVTRGRHARAAAGCGPRCSFSVTSKHGDLAVAPARRDHRNLALERHEGLEDRRLAAESLERRGRIAAVARSCVWPLPS